MCCNDKKDDYGTQQMRGVSGSPVGMEIDPADFMNPGSGLNQDDVLGAIYAKVGLPPDEEMGEPRGMMDEPDEPARARGGY